MHTHYTSVMAAMMYMKAVEAGADIIDTAISTLALGTSQPAERGRCPALRVFPGWRKSSWKTLCCQNKCRL
jgi:pyruvate/oxaloacetate carboxyltransferase